MTLHRLVKVLIFLPIETPQNYAKAHFFPQKKYNNQQETTDVWSDFGDTTLNNSEVIEYFL